MINKRSLSFVVLVLVIIISLNSVYAANIFTNPGFEDGLTGWTKNAWYQKDYSTQIDSSIHKLGDNSAKLTVTGVNNIAKYCNGTEYNVDYAANSIKTDELIVLKPNTDYELKSWVRMDRDSDTDKYFVRTTVLLFQNEDDWENLPSCQKIDPDRRIQLNKEYSLNEDEWKLVTQSFKTNSENIYARVHLIIEVKDSSGDLSATAWFDDTSLKEVVKDEKDNHRTDNIVDTCEIGECDDSYLNLKTAKTVFSESDGSVSEITLQDLTPNKKQLTGLDDSSLKKIVFWLMIAIAIVLFLIVLRLVMR